MLSGRRGVRQTRTFFRSDSFLRATRLVLVEKKGQKERQEELFAVCLFVISSLQPRRAVSGVRAPNPISQQAIRLVSEVEGPLGFLSLMHYDH